MHPRSFLYFIPPTLLTVYTSLYFIRNNLVILYQLPFVSDAISQVVYEPIAEKIPPTQRLDLTPRSKSSQARFPPNLTART